MANPASSKFSFDEFKLYYESAEKVTDRRIETNRWNYSICIAIIIAVAAMMKWSLTTASLRWLGFSTVALLCIMAIFFCALWIAQIRDFKKLNAAKFEVLNDMAPRLEFDLERPGTVVSCLPFESEWKKLSGLNALDTVGRSNLIALKSSNMEYFIPKAFGVLFGGILIVLLGGVVFDWMPSLEKPSEHAVSAPSRGDKKP